jgi:hypothetical protein
MRADSKIIVCGRAGGPSSNRADSKIKIHTKRSGIQRPGAIYKLLVGTRWLGSAIHRTLRFLQGERRAGERISVLEMSFGTQEVISNASLVGIIVEDKNSG